MRQDIEPVLLFSIGGITAIIMIYTGLVLIARPKKGKNKK